MTWTAIVIFMKTGKVIDSFTFTGPHGGKEAFLAAKDYTLSEDLDIAAVIPGNHPVYFK